MPAWRHCGCVLGYRSSRSGSVAFSSMRTRFTELFGVSVPVCAPPMNGISGGKLAAAVARAGGLGFISTGRGNLDDLSAEVQLFKEQAPVGAPLAIGFISWMTVTCENSILEQVLQQHRPNVVWFFAPAAPSAKDMAICKERGVKIVSQVGTVQDAKEASDMGADCVVVQGTEAGGHGLRLGIGRGTLGLAAAVAQELESTGKPVLAAGGIVDGKGLMAALALGCHGAVMGTRYWATHEAKGNTEFKQRIIALGGDNTVRTSVFDMVMAAHTEDPVAWPAPYDSSRVARNMFTMEWHGNEPELAAELNRDPDGALCEYVIEARNTGDLEAAPVYMGEGADLIHSIESAEAVTRTVMEEAEACLDRLVGLRESGSAREGLADLELHTPPESVPQPVASCQSPQMASPQLHKLGPRTLLVPDEQVFRPRPRRTAHDPRLLVSGGSAYEALAGYSRAVRASDNIQVSGTTATKLDGSGVHCEGSAEGQVLVIMARIQAALERAGSSLEDIVRTRMYVVRQSDMHEVMEAHGAVFKDIRPAATIVQVSGLAHPAMLVEIEAEAQVNAKMPAWKAPSS